MASTTYTPYVEAEDYLKLAQQQQIAEAQANAQAAMTGLDTQQTRANEAYDRTAQQIYQGTMADTRALALANQARGLYGSGYAETSLVGLQNAAGYNRTAADLQRQQTLQDIADQRLKYEYQGQADVAGVNASYASLLADLSRSREDTANTLTQQALENENNAYRQKLSDAYSAAEYGDFSQLESLGINTADAKAIYAAQKAATINAAYSGSGSTKKKEMTQEQSVLYERGVQESKALINNYINRGLTAAFALSEIMSKKDFYTRVYGEYLWNGVYDYFMNNYPGLSNAPAAAQPSADDYYNAAMESMMATGSLAAAQKWVAANAKDLAALGLTSKIAAVLQDMAVNEDSYFGTTKVTPESVRAGSTTQTRT